MENPKEKFKRNLRLSVIVLTVVVFMLGLIAVVDTVAQESRQDSDEYLSSDGTRIAQFGLIAAAIAFGFGAMGAGIAIAHVGAAAMGAIAEKPEIASQALIFIALAEGLVVFGFITALMILGKF